MIKKTGIAKFIAFILTLCMVMSMSPVITFALSEKTPEQDKITSEEQIEIQSESQVKEQLQVAGDEKTPVKYYKPIYNNDGDPASGLKGMIDDICTDYKVLDDNMKVLNSGWYVVDSNITVQDQDLLINGDVNLILCDGQGYHAAGLWESIAVNEDSSLTVYGQEKNTGEITIRSTDTKCKFAAIGGEKGHGNGRIEINGGTLNVSSGEGAGIGGGENGTGKDIIINGGNIYAKSYLGAAIGGGWNGAGKNIIINGGEVTAEALAAESQAFTTAISGAGIGGGGRAEGCDILINGGKVGARGLNGGAGIGGGYYGHGHDINITGGKVTAKGGSTGAGIGGGEDRDGYNITIKCDTVTATGGYSGGAGIGGGEGGSANKITIESGEVTANGDGGGAAIGGGEHYKGGGNAADITIKGGVVTAYGNSQSSGIGGGADGGAVNGIKITGGIVTAYGDQEGAGIGGGKKSEAYNITISGKETRVYAQGGVSGGAGIGGARNRTGADIHIEDGAIVTARSFSKSPNPSAIGGGSDGDSARIYIYKDSVVRADNSYLPQTVIPNDEGDLKGYIHRRLNCTVIPNGFDFSYEPEAHSGSWEGFIATGTASKTRNVITWNKVADADGYDVYFAKCGKKLKKVKSVTGLKYTKKGLKAKRNYKYKVKAYVSSGGKKKYIAQTPLIHVAGSKTRYSNAVNLAVNPEGIQVKAGTTKTLNVRITKKSSKKNVLWKGHAASKIRYMSTDNYVATVSSKGKIKAVNEGIAYVYAYTANGAYARVTVIVE